MGTEMSSDSGKSSKENPKKRKTIEREKQGHKSSLVTRKKRKTKKRRKSKRNSPKKKVRRISRRKVKESCRLEKIERKATYEMINGRMTNIEGKDFAALVQIQLQLLKLIAKSVDSGSLSNTKKYLQLLPKGDMFQISVAQVILDESLKCAIIKGYVEITVELLKTKRVNPFAGSISLGGSSFEEACKRNYVEIVELMMECCPNYRNSFVEQRNMRRKISQGLAMSRTNGFSTIVKTIGSY